MQSLDTRDSLHQLVSGTALEADASGKHEQEPPSKPPESFPFSKAWLRSSPYDFFVMSGGIDPGVERIVSEALETAGDDSDRAILWLSTPGGSPDGAYMMARAFQRKYKHFAIFINGYCKSSGTLVCLGADSLIMGENGHLGPLDIQILNREEFGERHSGLNPMTALDALGQQATEFLRRQFLDVRFGGGLSTKQALEVSTNLAGHLFSPITAQLDFMKYGEFTRSMRIGIEYGERLTQHRDSSNLKTGAVYRLAMGYPSHGFAIDREEARDTLFSCVEDAPKELMLLARELAPAVDKHLNGSENAPLFVDLRKVLEVAVPTKDVDEPSCPSPEAALRAAQEEMAAGDDDHGQAEDQHNGYQQGDSNEPSDSPHQ